MTPGSDRAGALPRRRRARGFTLIEVVIVSAMLAFMFTFLIQILMNTVESRAAIREELEGPKLETAVLDELIRDLRFVYYRPGLLPANAGFWGRSKTINGRHGDRVDFLTCRTSRRAELEDTNQAQTNAPLVEVSWACRASETDSRLIELWRREDYFVDDDPTDGGKFTLVLDRLAEFELRYYPPTEERAEGDNGLEEWDSKVQHKVPYAIVVSLKYYVQAPGKDDRNATPQGNVRRIILLTPARSVAPDAATGMDSGMSSMR